MISLEELEGLLHDTLNRIDGVYVGDPNKLLRKVLGWVEEGGYVFVAGDEYFESDSDFRSLNYLRYIRIGKENYKEVYEKLTYQNRRIDILYIFDEKLNPVLSIDDYPEDISLYIDFFSP